MQHKFIITHSVGQSPVGWVVPAPGPTKLKSWCWPAWTLFSEGSGEHPSQLIQVVDWIERTEGWGPISLVDSLIHESFPFQNPRQWIEPRSRWHSSAASSPSLWPQPEPRCFHRLAPPWQFRRISRLKLHDLQSMNSPLPCRKYGHRCQRLGYLWGKALSFDPQAFRQEVPQESDSAGQWIGEGCCLNPPTKLTSSPVTSESMVGGFPVLPFLMT